MDLPQAIALQTEALIQGRPGPFVPGVTKPDVLSYWLWLLGREAEHALIRSRLMSVSDRVPPTIKDLESSPRSKRDGEIAVTICATCNDTHMMPLGDREVMCTRCPTPCERCRGRGPGLAGGPYCAATQCGCSCHGGQPIITSQHLAANSPEVTLALIVRIRELEETIDDLIRALGSLVEKGTVAR